MQIEVLSTGSIGNCYRIKTGQTTLLIECGLPYKKIQKLLNFQVSGLDACIISHSHGDHAKAVKDLMKAGVTCYTSKGTAETLDLKGRRLRTFQKTSEDDYKIEKIKDLLIKPFKAIHDVKESVNFYIKNTRANESLMFVTDTAYLEYKIPNIDYLMLECNYIKKVLDENVKNGVLNASLRNRIVNNHMSLETAKEALKQADLSRCKRIYLLHLSDKNSNAYEIKQQVQELTGCEVWI